MQKINSGIGYEDLCQRFNLGSVFSIMSSNNLRGNFNRFKIKDYQVILFTLLVLGLFYVLSFLVDIYDFMGIRSWLYEHESITVPFLWDYLFTEGGPVEILQWLLIGLFGLAAGYLAGLLRAKERLRSSRFWFLFALLAVLMIMEDAGNVRHFLTERAVLLFYDDMLYRSITELIYFGLIAFLPLTALIKYRYQLFRHRRTAAFLLVGCFFYAVAVGMSGTRDIGFWYQTAGGVIYDLSLEFGGEKLLALYEETDEILASMGQIEIRYRMMDYLVEESLELLGAAFLWAASLSFLENLTEILKVKEDDARI